MSPGFGGSAAVCAAVLAFTGVHLTVRAQRHANRKQQWWERARWALDLTLSSETTTRTVGLDVLEALSRSEYAGEHEFEVVDAAVARALDQYAPRAGAKVGRGSQASASLSETEGGDRHAGPADQ